jgi:hypothetical protein
MRHFRIGFSKISSMQFEQEPDASARTFVTFEVQAAGSRFRLFGNADHGSVTEIKLNRRGNKPLAFFA